MSVWDDEKLVERLAEIWNAGASGSDTANQLSAEFGIEIRRNMVIAKVDRLRASGVALRVGDNTGYTRKRVKKVRALQRPPMPKPEPTVRQNALAEVLARAPREPAPKEENPADFPDRVPLQQLVETSCRWPIGDPLHDDFGFCGHAKVRGLPYCEHHARRAYQAPEVRQRAPKPVVVPTFNDLEKV
jgi:GcrA cell cycle regulator